MRAIYRIAFVAGTLAALSAASAADRLREQVAVQSAVGQTIDAAAETSSGGVATPPSETVLAKQEAEGILGKEIRSTADENMGRIIDVVVDRNAQPRAAVIDFGGFLGVGSRKIAIDWNLLHFDVAGDARSRITVELTQDQVRSAPEYKPGKPVVVMGGLTNLQPSPFANSATPD
jgi:hypothetical protein